MKSISMTQLNNGWEVKTNIGDFNFDTEKEATLFFRNPACNQKIKVGDFVEGSYKYGTARGIVKKVLKNHVVVSKHTCYYDTMTDTKEDLNISIARIHAINRSVTFK